MTMVAIGKFDDGAVLVSDSRASYMLPGKLISNDSLQKILLIGKARVFCYSGSVNIANEILKQLKILNKQKREYQYLDGIVRKLPGLLKSVFVLSPSKKKQGGLSVIVGGKLLSGDIKFWVMHHPNFVAVSIDSHYVIGSGSVVKTYLDSEIDRIKVLPNLKAKADALMVGLSSELSKHGIESVGGMLQIVLVSKDGVQPLNYGYVDLDPEAPPSSAYMEMQNGQWMQHDFTKGQEIPIVTPAILLTQHIVEKRVQDYIPPSASKKEPKWHLNYFMTANGIRIGPGKLEFLQPAVSVGSHKFPIVCIVMVGIGFWGSAGKEKLTLLLDKDGKKMIVGEIPFEIQYFPEDIDIQIQLKLVIDKPGLIFIEARVSDKVLGRRVMYFGKVEGEEPKTDAEKIVLLSHVREQLQKGLIKQTDSVVDGGKTELVYFFLCQDYKNERGIETFQNQFWVCYWKQYPLPLACYVASAFRLSVGKHNIKIDLVDATNQSSTQITTATVLSKSSCIINPVHGKVVIQVPKPGYYYVNIYVDGVLTGTSVLIAETDKPQFSYTLLPEIEKEVQEGQLQLMVKRSYQKLNYHEQS